MVRYYETCPRCRSGNTTLTHTHSSHGYSGYICNDCGQVFGN